MSTLSALADYPQRVKDLFLTRKVNRYGIYCVQLCIFGVWQAIVIDDFFPCKLKKEAFKPAFTKGNGREIWVFNK